MLSSSQHGVVRIDNHGRTELECRHPIRICMHSNDYKTCLYVLTAILYLVTEAEAIRPGCNYEYI